MPETTIQVGMPDGRSVTAIRTEAEGAACGWLFLYAPGAGSNVHDLFGRYCCRRLAAVGFACLRIQFPYMEERRRGPDRPAVLEQTWRAVIDAAREPGVRLAAGGRSMGGRIASQVVAQGVEADALVLFAYPLHPPGKPERTRDEHLPAIEAPAFFCSGTRDAFASPEELRAAAAKVPRSAVHLLAGADHGFAVPKTSGRTREGVWAEAVDALLDWLRTLEA